MRPPSSNPQEGGGARLPRLQLQALALRQQVIAVLQCARVPAVVYCSCRRHHKDQTKETQAQVMSAMYMQAY